MVVCLVATLGVTAANLRLTYVTDSNGAKQVILTSATDPAKVMSLSGIQSEEGDQVYYTAFSGNLATLNIERAFSVNIQADGQEYPPMPCSAPASPWRAMTTPSLPWTAW